MITQAETSAVVRRAQGGSRKSAAGANWTEQVSFVIQHEVKPGFHEQYEKWLKKIIKEAAKFHGHYGAQVARPEEGGHVYEIAVRFASRQDAEKWINSETRHKLIEELKPIISHDEKIDIKSGVDYWFTTYTEGHKAPKRWKQWLMSVSVIWPLTMVVPMLWDPLFKAFPVLGTWGLRQGFIAMTVVFFVVYVVMPPYAKRMAQWLSK